MKTRDKIIQTAAAQFAEKGYNGVSIRDITQKAGVNLGAITYHFGGKEGLFTTIMSQKRKPLMRIMEQALHSELGPREKLEYIMTNAGLHIMHTDPSLRVIFARTLQGQTGVPRIIQEGLQHRNRMVGTILREGIEKGVFRECNVENATWMFFGMVMPFMLHDAVVHPKSRRGAVPREAVEEVTSQALDIFFRGIAK